MLHPATPACPQHRTGVLVLALGWYPGRVWLLSPWELSALYVPNPCATRPGVKPSVPVSCLELGALGVKFSPSIRCPDFEV